MDNGEITTCMDKEYIPGQMGGGMKVSTKTIRRADLELIDEQMDGCMKGSGIMGGSMEKEFIFCLMVRGKI